MNTVLQGAVAMGCAVAGLFLLRFWQESRDRLFLYFTSAFWLLAISYVLLGSVSRGTDWRADVFIPRPLAFCLILIGIFEKNRR